MRPQLRPDIQVAVQPLIDEARAEGYAAGLEAAAKWHEKQTSQSIGRRRGALHREDAKAIRALGKEGA